LIANDETILQDIITNEEFKFVTGTNNQTNTGSIDGQILYVNTTSGDGGSVRITWGASAGYDDPGAVTTLFPRIRLENGGWIAFLIETEVEKDVYYSLPGITSKIEYIQGKQLVYEQSSETRTSFGEVDYVVEWDSGNKGVLSEILLLDVRDCGFRKDSRGFHQGPAVLFLEEKAQGNENGHAICVGLTSDSLNEGGIVPTDPVSSDETTDFGYWGGFHNFLDSYGTYSELHRFGENFVTIRYPDNQMNLNIYAGKSGMESLCTDSDGGLNYYERGTCSYGSEGMSDGCIVGGDHDGWLREVSCGSGGCEMHDYKCPYECQDGKCIERVSCEIFDSNSDSAVDFLDLVDFADCYGEEW
jgi:hypothetical protein